MRALVSLREHLLPATLGKVSGVSYAVTGQIAGGYDDIAAQHTRTPIVLATVGERTWYLPHWLRRVLKDREPTAEEAAAVAIPTGRRASPGGVLR